MKIIACYVRVSTIDQNEAGQMNGIRQWLTGNGVPSDAVQWYVDKQSGDAIDRPAFNQLQKDIFNGTIGTVVVWKLDRLSRKIQDGLNVLCDWCGRGLRVVSTTQQIDFNGTVGKLIAAVLLGVAQMEQEVRRERQRAGIEVAKARGVYMGRKPGTTKANMDRVRTLYAKGMTQGEIATVMDIHRNTVSRYLSNSR